MAVVDGAMAEDATQNTSFWCVASLFKQLTLLGVNYNQYTVLIYR